MVSVVIPLYNKVGTVGKAIESVIKQSYSDFELIVVDDGSNDGSDVVVKQYSDNRIRYIRQNNGGVSQARNHGIAESKGSFIAFLDADDQWYPNHLESNIRLTEKYPQCSVFATTYDKSDANGNVHHIMLNKIPEELDFLMDNYFEIAAVSYPPIHTGSVMVSSEAIKAVGGFPEGVAQGEDLLTWARLAVNYKIAYCTIPQSVFNTGEQSRWDTPKRIPPENDKVGCELEKLYKKHPEVIGLKQYISMWHKMRASMFLRIKGMTASARNEIRIARSWHPNKKLILYLLLTFLPFPLRKLFFLH